MNKKYFILYIILMLWLLTGCWNSRELNTLGISLVMGLDIEENDVIVITVEVIKPRPVGQDSGGETTSQVKYVQGRGKTIFEAVRNMTVKFDRQLFASHTKVYIFGEEFAKKKIIDYIDFLQRDHELRETANILIAKNSKAYEVMGNISGIEDIPGNYISELIKNKKLHIKTVDVDLVEFLKNYYESGAQPVIGVIEKKEKKPIGNKNKKEYELSVEGASVFKKAKLVGYLNGDEVKGYNFVKDKIKGGVIEFPTPNVKADKYSTPTPKVKSHMEPENIGKKGMSTVENIRSKTKKDIIIKDGKIIFKVKVVMKAMLGEIEGDVDISKEEGIRALEEACSLEIKKEIENAIKKAQEKYKVDIFGFSSIFHRKYTKEWQKVKNNWNNIFSNSEFLVEVETDILRSGLTNISTKRIKGE